METEGHLKKNLIENMPTAFAYHKVIYDKDNNAKDYIFLKVNNKFEELTDLKREEVINKKATDVLNNIVNDDFNWIQLYGEVALTGKSIKFQEYSGPLGRWYEVKAYSKEKGYFTTIFNDITERKLKEKELKEKTEKLDSIYNNLDDIIWSISWPDLHVKFVSRAVKDICGYTRDKFKEDPLFIIKITHPDDIAVQEETLRKLEEKGYAEREFRVITKEGNIKWIYDKGKMIYDENNNPVRIEGIMRDITERKATKNKLKYTRERYETIFNSAPMGIMIEDGKGDIIEVNEEMSKMSGYGKEELEDSNVIDKLVLSKYEEIAKDNLKRIINGENLEFDIKTPIKSGEMKYYHLKETNIDLSSGEKGILSMHMDVTERKKQRDELEFQLNFQKTIAEVSSDLLEINSTNIDKKINRSLEKIGKFFNVDRGYIIKLSEDKKLLSNINEWCKNGVKSEKENFQNIPTSNFSWSLKKLTQNQHINIEDVDKMSKKAEPEQRQLKALGIKSLVIIPMFIENELFGFFVFDSVNEKRSFTEEKIRLLNIFTDLITNAFSKHINNKKIRKLTYKDSLTDLYNRRYFEQEMERLDTKRQLPTSIIMVDINGLKIINDSYGHDTGDQMLLETGKILKDHIRNEDILARHGGDEFTILLPQTSNEEVEKIVSRLNDKEHKITKKGITISFSLGFATKVNEDEEIGEVLKEADDDMYKNKLSESKSHKNKLVQNLLNTLETKSSETKEHAIRMNNLAHKFGKKLGLSNSELNNLSLIATLHDIGKTTISEDILTKPEKLTEKEWEIMKEHSVKGYKIASASEDFALVAEEILCHHEYWNGNGYPDGLQGKEIPYLSRIISIIDAYDVMINERPYSESRCKEEALAEIKECAGSQFDPELAMEFIEMQKDKLS